MAVGAVALVERGGDAVCGRPGRRRECGGAPAALMLAEERHERRRIRSAYRGVAVAGSRDAVERDGEGGEGGEVRVDVQPVVGEPGDVLLDECERTGLVPGERREDDVVGDDAQVVGVVLGQSVTAQVRGLRLVEAPGAEVGEEHAGEGVLRFLSAGEAALDHLFHQDDGLRVAVGVREEARDLAPTAGVAVAVIVARCGFQLHPQRLRFVHASGIPGVLETGGEHTAQGRGRRRGSASPCRRARRRSGPGRTPARSAETPPST